MTEKMNRPLWISFMLHGIVATMLFLRAVILPSEPISIRNAIRVDVVDLPDKLPEMPKEPPAPEQKSQPEAKIKETAPPEPKAEPKPTAPAVDLKAKKRDLSKSQKDAMAKLKQMEALKKLSEAKQHKEGKPATVVKGNQISQGNALTGLEKIDYDRYFDDIKAKVLSQWSIPQWLADAQLKASVTVLIDERGYVIKKMIRRSSGNEVFDAKAIEAVEASSPFPEPPQRLRGILSTSGIVFNFPE